MAVYEITGKFGTIDGEVRFTASNKHAINPNSWVFTIIHPVSEEVTIDTSLLDPLISFLDLYISRAPLFQRWTCSLRAVWNCFRGRMAESGTFNFIIDGEKQEKITFSFSPLPLVVGGSFLARRGSYEALRPLLIFLKEVCGYNYI